MLDKIYLEETIKAQFPDLYNTRFEINSQAISSFTLGNLLPFLVYQNTVDANHRIIGLYLPDDKNIINLVPFYVVMGQYRKLLNKVMRFNNYQNMSYKPNELQITYNANIGYISSVDFINRQINLRFGRGNEMNLPFQDSYKIRFLNTYDHKIRDQIESFDYIDNADTQNIFTFPLEPKMSQYEGVIIFTNTSKFESLLRNIRVSENDIRDHLNIQKVTFPASGIGHTFSRMSARQTSAKPVSVLFARTDAFRAYFDILESGQEKLSHIKTIIIDDFDEMILKWQKSDQLDVELKWLRDNYIQQTNNGQIKDIYFICKNSTLSIHDLFKKYDISYHPWLIKPLHSVLLNEEILPAPAVSINNVGISAFEHLNEDINALINSWKDISDSNYCNGEIIFPIRFLYDLRTKLNSFFNSDGLNKLFSDFLTSLELLRSKYFFAGQDYGLIANTENLIKLKCKDFSNFKLNIILEYLKNNENKSMVIVISDNSNDDDIIWLTNSINKLIPGIKLSHCYKNDLFQLKQISNTSADVIFYLSTDKVTLGKALGNALAPDQIFILNDRAYSFTSGYAGKFQQLQKITGGTQSQYLLLNINAPSTSSVDDNSGSIPLKYKQTEAAASVRENITVIGEAGLSDLVEGIFIKHKSTVSTALGQCMLFFDNGTFEMLPETRKVYLYDDDKEVDDIEKALKPVFELKEGDQIILPKKNAHVKDLLEHSLKQNEHFSKSITIDIRWRDLIKSHIQRCGMDLSFFRKKLRDNGFNIVSDQTIQNWIDGDTRRPDNFKELLKALESLQIIKASEINVFDEHNSELKSVQIMFVRRALSKLLSRLNGIDIEDDENFTDELLNNFIDHIEVKKISSIHKL